MNSICLSFLIDISEYLITTMIELKVCGMMNHDNVEAIKELEPNYMGFIFHPQSPRYVGDSPAIYLFVLPSKINKVAVFVNETTEKILTVCKRYRFEFVQLHGGELPNQCDELKSEGLKVIKAFDVNEDFDFSSTEAYADSCEFFLFDMQTDANEDSGKSFNWKLLSNYKTDKKFILSGGIQLKDAAELKRIDHKQFMAVDINSGFEIEPGLKDNRRVALFKQLLNN